jgi:hypothetical protein
VPSWELDEGSPRPPAAAGSGIGRRILAAVIAVAAAVMLALGIHHGVELNNSVLNPATVAQNTATDARVMCMYRGIRQELPEGATFYDAPTKANVYHFQRLAEVATLWAVPRTTESASEYLIKIAKGGCAGIRVEVQRR